MSHSTPGYGIQMTPMAKAQVKIQQASESS
jgi:hypothetical protein